MFSSLREPMNGFTHFIGIIFAITALSLLLNRTEIPVTGTHVFAFIVYGIAMILLFSISTLYHWLPIEGKRLEVLRKVDHIMIFIFIAASYSPICLINFAGVLGYLMLGIVWVTAIAGFFMKIFWLNAPRILYTSIYLLMGWVIVFAFYPLTKVISSEGLIWFIVGGVFYTLGAIIYAFKKPDPFPGILGFHEIFHIFILLGVFSHFMMNYLCV